MSVSVLHKTQTLQYSTIFQIRNTQFSYQFYKSQLYELTNAFIINNIVKHLTTIVRHIYLLLYYKYTFISMMQEKRNVSGRGIIRISPFIVLSTRRPTQS